MTALPADVLALLKEALEAGSLSLAYQPQVELASRPTVAREALSLGGQRFAPSLCCKEKEKGPCGAFFERFWGG